MDIKIRFTKRSAVIMGGVVLCGLIGWGCWMTSDFKARRDIKATCQSNCECFANIVDYRLTDEQVQSFKRFSDELQRRPSATPLEFLNPTDVVTLQQAFAVCQPKPSQAVPPMAQPRPVQPVQPMVQPKPQPVIPQKPRKK